LFLAVGLPQMGMTVRAVELAARLGQVVEFRFSLVLP
jgi:hypothetical protein